MIVKIIPEEGDKDVVEVEHKNIQDFFMFGNKRDEDGDFVDFHDYRGKHRYLIGSMAYFSEVIKSDRISSSHSSTPIVKEIKLDAPSKDSVLNTEMDNVISLNKHLKEIKQEGETEVLEYVDDNKDTED